LFPTKLPLCPNTDQSHFPPFVHSQTVCTLSICVPSTTLPTHPKTTLITQYHTKKRKFPNTPNFHTPPKFQNIIYSRGNPHPYSGSLSSFPPPVPAKRGRTLSWPRFPRPNPSIPAIPPPFHPRNGRRSSVEEVPDDGPVVPKDRVQRGKYDLQTREKEKETTTPHPPRKEKEAGN
jgi:hypothetical protein